MIGVITKKGTSDIIVQRASQFNDENKKTEQEKEELKENKLLNIVFLENDYYCFEPCNSDANKY